MPSPGETAGDPFDLRRFLTAQERDYHRALAELRAGRKCSHWMWYVFPQCHGLGHTATARLYAIKSLEEARAYLAHPVLGERLLECAAALLEVEGRSAREIMGSPDDLKLRSSATLFAIVSAPGSLFERLLQKYFGGQHDPQTLELLGLDGAGLPSVTE